MKNDKKEVSLGVKIFAGVMAAIMIFGTVAGVIIYML